MQINYKIQVGDTLSKHQIKKIEKVIQQTFQEIDLVFNNWNPSSEISELSKLLAYEKKVVSPPLLRLLQQAQVFYFQSGKRFDISIGALLKLYRDSLKKGSMPSKKDQERAEKSVGWEKVHIEGNLLWKEEGGIGFDLGGIAKGLAVDMLMERLQALKLDSLYVEWGGEIRCCGKHPQGRLWSIAIENSDKVISLENRACATSGDYYQYWSLHGREYFHIVDPIHKKLLEKKKGSISSITVTASTCLAADIFATSLMLFSSPEEALAWITQFPDIEVVNLQIN